MINHKVNHKNKSNKKQNSNIKIVTDNIECINCKSCRNLNGLNGELKAIEKYSKLSQEIVILMRKNRIVKYSKSTQDIILNIMNSCLNHLDNELNENNNKCSKKEVIDIT